MTAVASSQGAAFTFNAVTFQAKNVKTKVTREVVDVSDLSLTDGAVRKLQVSPLAHGSVISCEFFGLQQPDMTASHAISCSTLGISGNAICTDYEATAAVGELLMGTASFTITG